MRVWILLLVLLVLLVLLAPLAWAGEPFVRLKVEPEGELVAGQAPVLEVQMLVPNYFLAPPAVQPLRLRDGTLAEQVGGSANRVERIDGQTYAGITRRYQLPPLPAGEHELAPAEIRLRFAGEDGQPLEARLPLPSRHFQVRPAGAGSAAQAQELGPGQLSLSDSYEPAAASLQVGDVLVRQLTTELHDAGNLLPPRAPLATPVGVRLYRTAPRLELDDQRGARRRISREAVRYLFTQPGSVVLPAIKLRWRDTRSGRWQTAALPPRILQIAPRAAAQDAPAQLWRWLLAGGVLLVLLATLLWRFAPQAWRQRLAARTERRRRWRRLREACHAGQAAETEVALDAWLALHPSASEQLPGLQQARQQLLVYRYGRNAVAWDPKALLAAAARLPRPAKRAVNYDGLNP
ncbi:hypothetical protein PH586_19775 [Pseudomonas sp. SA3-5]|uniref:DUF7939 domain-containing protein n=1 Tax=Pseudomonas aestuarii TaxID=3018340 RepID=A0ABT4XK93_9PSED|nr:hypothetical protein [Pseudomonas aestuarii]MDA7088623.1 hypothetical protein [Pseudomonas aestuarii]